ncbi:MAG TPA: hypothetical protein VE010_04585 [Thermoanaerobaculia bacterium]|nr:hypothetical protein [Thermoanaerobaculia bacterium]
MARRLTVITLALLLSGAAVGGLVSAAMPGLTIDDFIEAWPTSERFTDGILERLIAYLGALQGRADGRRDIAAGRLEFRMWGLPAPWRFIFAETLQRHGVRTTVVSGCVVSQPQLASWEGYNDVMRSEVERRFGDTFLNETAEKAEEEFDRRRARGELPWQRSRVGTD